MNACNQLIRGTLRHRAGPPSRLLNSTSIFSPPSCTVVKVYGFEPAPLMLPHIRSQPYSGTTFICHDHHDHHAVEMPNLKKSTEVSSQGREKELGEVQENDIDDEVRDVAAMHYYFGQIFLVNIMMQQSAKMKNCYSAWNTSSWGYCKCNSNI